MATNLSIDPGLLETALKIGGMKTKRETVNQALREFIQKRRMADLIAIFGSVDYDEDYDHKKARWRENGPSAD